jgi:hypothetical protein
MPRDADGKTTQGGTKRTAALEDEIGDRRYDQANRKHAQKSNVHDDVSVHESPYASLHRKDT